MADSTFISHNLAITPYDGAIPFIPLGQNIRPRNDGGDSAQPVPGAKEEIENDSEMWNMYLDEVKEEDNRITDAWKEDANSIVTFTGLFSAIVGAFIIEFYKKLSPDSGDQTVALLQQISHQLSNFPNNTDSNANQSSAPTTAMVWVIAMWLISLVLSLNCALIATLLQQWARRYIETPRSSTVLRHRARVRSLLLVGTKLYKIPLIVEIIPTLLHLSVYLFLAGLVITFHTIHNKVAIAVDVAIGISGLAYLTLSILPCLDMRCPYRTPISKIVWYPCHAFLSFAALCLHRCILGLRHCRLLNRPVLSRGQSVLQRWLQSRGFSITNHWKFLTDGLEKSIVFRAVETLKDGDRGRITWLFNRFALGDKQKFVKFAASIPIHRIPDLIPLKSVPFRESLLILLRSCLAAAQPGVGARNDSKEDRRSLLVCLHAIRHIAKTKVTIPDLDFMRDHFADTGHMRALWSGYDDSIRITSRSICALVARKVVRKPRLTDQDLHWLQEVTGSSPEVILDTNVAFRDQMNFKSFVVGALTLSRPYGPLPKFSAEDARSLNETLAIILGMRNIGNNYFTTGDWQVRLSEEVGRIQQYDNEGSREVLNSLRWIFPSLPAPVVHAIPPPRAASPYRGAPPPRNAPPSRPASPYRGVPLPRATHPPRTIPRPAVTPPGGHSIPSPHVAFIPGPMPSSSETHSFPNPYVLPRSSRPSRRARSPHAPM